MTLRHAFDGLTLLPVAGHFDAATGHTFTRVWANNEHPYPGEAHAAKGSKYWRNRAREMRAEYSQCTGTTAELQAWVDREHFCHMAAELAAARGIYA
jgi:hypothetical protein